MSKIARKTQTIFASSASNNGVFGSGADGTKILSNDPAVLMEKTAWAQGWLAATIGSSKFPCLEEFQALDYINTYQLTYIFQEGIPEYDSGTIYFQNSVVKQAGTFNLYGSIADNNQGNALSDTGHWELLGNLTELSSGTTGALLIANALSELSGSAATARGHISAAASGANTDITSLNSPSLGSATCTTPSGSDSSSRVMNTYYYVNQGSGDVGTDAQCWGGNGTAFSNNSTYSGSTIQGVGSFNFNFGTWKALSTVQIGGWGGDNYLTTFRRVA